MLDIVILCVPSVNFIVLASLHIGKTRLYNSSTHNAFIEYKIINDTGFNYVSADAPDVLDEVIITS